MQDLKGKTAVVTGAASGIGLATARRLATEGMQLVVADIKPDELENAAGEIEGVDVLALPTDVADADAVMRLADAAYERFGSVDVLCPNAGVLGPPAVKAWEAPLEDWQRVYGANVFGVVNTIAAFVPRMLEADRDGHIVVTASIRSLMVGPGAPPYMSSKHAVFAITEVLRMQLEQVGSKINVSALCPGPVRTQEFLNEVAYAKSRGRDLKLPEDLIKRAQAGGFSPMDPNEVADNVVAGIRADLPYIFTHASSKDGVMEWLDPIIKALDEQVG